jgi:hypothetical protein
LWRELDGEGSLTTRRQSADWQRLVKDFGEDVARAYRDAAVAHWRNFTPALGSEGDEARSVPISLIFAMAGLEIEASEGAGFPKYLDEKDVRHALRYVTHELNGFPSWLEAMHAAFPALTMEAVERELNWELSNTNPNQPMHYILHDLAHYAPWFHDALVAPILSWLGAPVCANHDTLRYCLRILKNGGTSPEKLAELARTQLTNGQSVDHAPFWYALWVDVAPDTDIDAVKNWLAGMGGADAIRAAQLFITSLMGDRLGSDTGPMIGNFRTASHLKALYILMHQYVQVREDIDRINGGTYSPELRDDAQDARNQLFGLLGNMTGKEADIAIKSLIHEHPDPGSRPWMAHKAYKRAEEDGDLEPWTAAQVYDFQENLVRTPATHRQLFDLTVACLHDLKNWLEDGNDSPAATWQKASTENEMRNLVAGWLNQNSHGRYSAVQEPELANRQRCDIWLQNPDVPSPVPIELKLLDQNWTGPQLCERLRNQLAGDYMREATAGCGVMLLIWRGNSGRQNWEINDSRVNLAGLREALLACWESIAGDFANVSAIDIVVIDLIARKDRSNQMRDPCC